MSCEQSKIKTFSDIIFITILHYRSIFLNSAIRRLILFSFFTKYLLLQGVEMVVAQSFAKNFGLYSKPFKDSDSGLRYH